MLWRLPPNPGKSSTCENLLRLVALLLRNGRTLAVKAGRRNARLGEYPSDLQRHDEHVRLPAETLLVTQNVTRGAQ